MGKIKSEELQLTLRVNSSDGREEIGRIKKAIADTKKELKNYNKELEAGTGDNKQLKDSIKETEQRLKQYKTDLDKATAALSLNDKTLNELRKDLRLIKTELNNAVPGTEAWKKYNAELQATQARIRELTAGEKSIGQMFASIKAGALGAVAAVAGIARAVKNVATKIADFEQANVNLSTILGVSLNQMSRLTENAKLLGRQTQYTASQVTGLQTELAKLGFTQESILAMTEPTLNFATAVGTDLSSAAALAGATLRIFGLQAEDTEDTLSVLAVATNKSALDFSFLQTSMSIVGPVAKSFGFSLRDTIALLGSLANAGFDASSAATATRNILLNLADSNGKLATALGGAVKTFPELIEGLQSLYEEGTDLNAALEMTDKRSVSAFSRFLEGTEATYELRDALEGVSGELDRIATTRMDTLQGSVLSLQSAWEGLILSFQNSAGPLKSIISGLAKMLNLFTDLRERINGIENETLRISVRNIINPFSVYSNGIEAVGDIAEWLQNIGKKKRNPEIAAGEGAPEFLGPELPTIVAAPTDDSDSGSGDGQPEPLKTKQAWSLASDESFLAAKAKLLAEFNNTIDEINRKHQAGELSSEEEFNSLKIAAEAKLDEDLYNLEVASLSARIATNKEKGTEREKLVISLNEKIKKHETDTAKARKEAEQAAEQLALDAEGNKTRIAEHAEKLRYEKEREGLEKKRALISNFDEAMENLERKHQNNLLRIQMDAFDRETKTLDSAFEVKKQEIITKWSKDRANTISGSGLDKEFLRRQSIELAEIEVGYQGAQLERLESHLKDIKQLRESFISEKNITEDAFQWENIGFTEEEYNALQSQIEKVRQAIAAANQTILGDEKTSGLFRGTGGELFGITQDQWNVFFNRLKEGKIKGEDMVNVLTAVGNAARMGLDITSKAIELTNAKEEKAFKQYQKDNEKKQKSLQDRLDSGLMTQAQYDAEIEQMKAEQEAKEEEMQLRQAQRAKRMNISQAIIESSLAVLKTYTQWGGWPAGVAPAAIMAAIGAAQVGLMSATPAMAKGGPVRADDGRTYNALLDPEKRGYVTGPTVIVGERGTEYVIPAAGLSNPTLAPIIANIENARRAGTLRSIDFRAAVPRAYAGGGFVSGTGGNQVTTVIGGAPSADLSRIEALLDAMTRKLDDPVPAIVSVTGPHGINEKMKEYDRYRSRGKLG